MVNSMIVNIAFTALGIYLVKLLLTRTARAPLPPGPRPLLAVLALPSGPDKEWLTYGKWGDIWGEITSVTVFGQPLIVLNSVKAATDLLNNRSSLYSDRPVFQMSGELVGWKRGSALLYYGTLRFRRSRKFFHQLFGSHVNVQRFYPIQLEENHKFLKRLLETPEELVSHIRRMISAVVLEITYGYTVEGDDDSIVRMVDNVMEEFSASIAPGAFLVDLIPILKYVPSWMPGAGFQRKAKLWATHLSEMIEVPFEFVLSSMAKGTTQDSFVSVSLREKPSEDEISDLKWAAGSVYAGAADTTVSAITTFFLSMARYPEVQAKAQAEIDAVIGTHRLPTFEDREKLPYVEALFKEVLRYHPIGPMGLPHRVMEDDMYEGYLIPKGSIVLANIWKMLHNPDTYANPMTFDPSRFLASDSHVPDPDPRDIVFGWGRRVCPGKLLGEAAVFITCAQTLATLTISKAVGKDGEVIEPVEDFLPGIISHAAPFVCSITPRSPPLISEA
ncbi:cytochrome P450 [Mycena rebaudengoi]|nr:cytochrome P450 [Mycena rebaudengoi]